jgi:lysozyme
MYDRAKFKKVLTRHEGYEKKPYVDTVGKITIGVGWNLTDNGLPDEIIERLLDISINMAEAMLDARIPWWRKLDDARQAVVLNMAFNMGGKLFTFVNTIAAIKRGEWEKAADGMRASKWAKQVGKRAEELARIMETGDEAAK